jgi:hypothetical protein
VYSDDDTPLLKNLVLKDAQVITRVAMALKDQSEAEACRRLLKSCCADVTTRARHLSRQSLPPETEPWKQREYHCDEAENVRDCGQVAEALLTCVDVLGGLGTADQLPDWFVWGMAMARAVCIRDWCRPRSNDNTKATVFLKAMLEVKPHRQDLLAFILPIALNTLTSSRNQFPPSDVAPKHEGQPFFTKVRCVLARARLSLLLLTWSL